MFHHTPWKTSRRGDQVRASRSWPASRKLQRLVSVSSRSRRHGSRVSVSAQKVSCTSLLSRCVSRCSTCPNPTLYGVDFVGCRLHVSRRWISGHIGRSGMPPVPGRSLFARGRYTLGRLGRSTQRFLRSAGEVHHGTVSPSHLYAHLPAGFRTR